MHKCFAYNFLLCAKLRWPRSLVAFCFYFHYTGGGHRGSLLLIYIIEFSAMLGFYNFGAI